MNLARSLLQPYLSPFVVNATEGVGFVLGNPVKFIGPDYNSGDLVDGTVVNFDASLRFESELPITYSLLGAWPLGIVIDPVTGFITGTMTPVGIYTGLGVRATVDGGTADSNLVTIELTAIPTPPIFNGVIPDMGGIPGGTIPLYNTNIHFGTGGIPLLYELVGTTNGMTINAETGRISGTWGVEAVNFVTVRATNDDGFAESNQIETTVAVPVTPVITGQLGSFFASTGSPQAQSISTNLVPGAVVGELLVQCVAISSNSFSGGVTSLQVPVGWTAITNYANVALNSAIYAAFYKIADGSEGTTLNIPLSAQPRHHNLITWATRISGFNAAAPIATVGTPQHTTSTGVTAGARTHAALAPLHMCLFTSARFNSALSINAGAFTAQYTHALQNDWIGLEAAFGINTAVNSSNQGARVSTSSILTGIQFAIANS